MKFFARLLMLSITLTTAVSGAEVIHPDHQRVALELQTKTYEAVQTPSKEVRDHLLTEVVELLALMTPRQHLAIVDTLILQVDEARAQASGTTALKQQAYIVLIGVSVLVATWGLASTRHFNKVGIAARVLSAVGVLGLPRLYSSSEEHAKQLQQHAIEIRKRLVNMRLALIQQIRTAEAPLTE